MSRFREPLQAYFRQFAVTVTTSGGAELQGIFDREVVEMLSEYAGGADGSRPVALMRTVDVVTAGIREDSTLTLPASSEAAFSAQTWWGGSSFTVRSVRPDGTGMSILSLQVAAA